MSNTPLDVFFSHYSCPGKYKYNRKAPITKEFGKLCRAYKPDWTKAQLDHVRAEYRDAVISQFNAAYGTDLDDLEAWHNLCQIIGITPVPEGLKECKKAVESTHVNLVDLIDTQRTGKPVKVFASEVELSRYTKAEEKFFPKDEAKAGGILKFLLRRILAPSSRGRGVRGRGRK